MTPASQIAAVGRYASSLAMTMLDGGTMRAGAVSRPYPASGGVIASSAKAERGVTIRRADFGLSTLVFRLWVRRPAEGEVGERLVRHPPTDGGGRISPPPPPKTRLSTLGTVGERLHPLPIIGREQSPAPTVK